MVMKSLGGGIVTLRNGHQGDATKKDEQHPYVAAQEGKVRVVPVKVLVMVRHLPYFSGLRSVYFR